jgi:predicted RNA binding protein YcfA (HicA-like mRNA interferase family)
MRLRVEGGDTRTVPIPNHRELAKGTLKSIVNLSGLDEGLFRR